MYTLKIDNREKDLINKIPQLLENENIKNVIVEKSALDIGDFVILDDNGNEQLIIERKSVNDLASSIQDGRYNEQSMRLNSLGIHNHNIMYLIEGDIRKYVNKYSRITKEALYSSLFSLNFYKGFSVFRSFDIDETGILIVKMVKKMLRDTSKKGYYGENKDNTTETQKVYTDVVKRVKKDNIRPDNIGEIILSQIPGISTTISKVLINKYGSLNEMIHKLSDNPDELVNETYITTKGQTRKISVKCIKSIKEYLLYKRDNHNINS
tara:strand:+ start:188 stop:985 length:798 start_codon:yes stop_codon:yes gene_type:complete